MRATYQLEEGDDISAVIGFHGFTGCDAVSAFWRKGKIRPFRLMMKNRKFLQTFSEIGNNWEISDELISEVEKLFVQCMVIV